MKVRIVEDALAVGRHAADEVEAALAAKRALTLALPTGETPMGLYRELADRKTDLHDAHVFNLDEYVGLGPDDALSCGAFMQAAFYAHTAVHPSHRHLPDTRAADLDAACARYEAELAQAGGIDLAVLGLGRNGHLGMNEPGTPFDSRTHVCTLAAGSLNDNARLYAPGAKLPARGITVGLATISSARTILLLAFGARKADAVAAALEGPIDPVCPASLLQRHPHLHVILDRAAAVGLQRAR